MIVRIRPRNYISAVGNGRSLVRDVRFSDVVFCNNISESKVAVGIAYDMKQSQIPFVTCRGEEYEAKRIIRICRMRSVNIREDPELVAILYKKCSIGSPIPKGLFQPVAKALATIYAKELSEKK